jgi:hypothetical protein
MGVRPFLSCEWGIYYDMISIDHPSYGYIHEKHVLMIAIPYSALLPDFKLLAGMIADPLMI